LCDTFASCIMDFYDQAASIEPVPIAGSIANRSRRTNCR
jgi:hypothetical protein